MLFNKGMSHPALFLQQKMLAVVFTMVLDLLYSKCLVVDCYFKNSKIDQFWLFSQ